MTTTLTTGSATLQLLVYGCLFSWLAWRWTGEELVELDWKRFQHEHPHARRFPKSPTLQHQPSQHYNTAWMVAFCSLLHCLLFVVELARDFGLLVWRQTLKESWACSPFTHATCDSASTTNNEDVLDSSIASQADDDSSACLHCYTTYE